MADLIDKLQNNPKALKLFLAMPEDKQARFLNTIGASDMKRSEQRAAFKKLIPGFSDRPVKDQMAFLDQFGAKSYDVPEDMKQAPAGTSPTLPTASEEAVQPISGPITDTLLMGTMMKAPPVQEAVESAAGALKTGAEGATNFASRVKNALTTSKSAAGQAIGDVERATPSALKAGKSLADFPSAIPFTNKSVNTLKTLEGQVGYINDLEKAAANADKLPKEALNDYAKINDFVKDQLPSNLRGRLFELDAKINTALNAKVPARAAAAQGLADVSLRDKILKGLGAAAATAGIYEAGKKVLQ